MRRRRRRRTALIKSNNPHLAGGEKHNQKYNHQKNNSTGRVTRKKKQKTNIITKKQLDRKNNMHFPRFLLFCFFLGYLVGVLFSFCFVLVFFLDVGFLVCFFGSLWLCVFSIFFKPYILCVAELITLSHLLDSFGGLPKTFSRPPGVCSDVSVDHVSAKHKRKTLPILDTLQKNKFFAG